MDLANKWTRECEIVLELRKMVSCSLRHLSLGPREEAKDKQ